MTKAEKQKLSGKGRLRVEIAGDALDKAEAKAEDCRRRLAEAIEAAKNAKPKLSAKAKVAEATAAMLEDNGMPEAATKVREEAGL